MLNFTPAVRTLFFVTVYSAHFTPTVTNIIFLPYSRFRLKNAKVVFLARLRLGLQFTGVLDWPTLYPPRLEIYFSIRALKNALFRQKN